MAIRLTVRPPGGHEPTELDFDQQRIRIGRGAMCDVRLPDLAVSAVHAMVLLDRDRYYLVDLGSTNGTVVGGEPLVVDRRKLLRSGDVFLIGEFRIEFQAGVAMLSSHNQDRTVAAARQLAKQVMVSGGLDLKAAALVVLGGPQAGERYEIPPPPATLTIGRGEQCDLLLVDGDVSREHATIEVTAEGVTLQDLGGKNPLMVNEREVSRCRLHDRDELLVGSTVLVLDEPIEAFLRDLADRPESETPAAEPQGETLPAPSIEGEAPDDEEAVDDEGSEVFLEEAADSSEQLPTPPMQEEGEPTAEPEVAAEEAPPADVELFAGPHKRGSAGSEMAILLVGALALAACVAALVWIFR